MPQKDHHRLVVVTGPSCVGKSPLKDALDREFPGLAETLETPVLYNSRAARPNEVEGEDYYFRQRQEIEKLRGRGGYLVVEARNDLQAVNLDEMKKLLERTDVFYEGNVHVALAIKCAAQLRTFPKVEVFVSPVSRDEVGELREGTAEFGDVVAEMMRRRLMRRLSSKKSHLTLPDLQDVEVRARSAHHELGHAHQFDHVLVNHDGEDSDHWEAFPRPVGDARRAVRTLAALLESGDTEQFESWHEDLVPLEGGCSWAGAS